MTSNSLPVVTVIHGGEDWESQVSNICGTAIPPPEEGYRKESAWHSDPMNPGDWAQVEIELPEAKALGRVVVASQHSGHAHMVVEIEVSAIHENSIGPKRVVTNYPDTYIDIEDPTETRKWQFGFRAGASGHVVIRGLILLDKEMNQITSGPVSYLTEKARYGVISDKPPWPEYVTGKVSDVHNILGGTISPVREGYRTYVDWHSAEIYRDNWVEVTITLPEAKDIRQFFLRSQHSGAHHMVQAVEMRRGTGSGFVRVLSENQIQPDHLSDFVPEGLVGESKTWMFRFQAGDSGYVVIRGLQLYDANRSEISPKAERLA